MIVNLRDLGGYEVDGGKHVQTGRLIRAAHLADATDADIAYLESLPTTLVVDFRTEVDLKGKTNRDVPGARYVNLPIDASGNAMATATEDEKKKMTGRKKFDVKKVILFAAFNEKAKDIAREMYPTLLFDPECQRQFARFLRLVLETENGAVLYHCTQGKDRTGIASALLLEYNGDGSKRYAFQLPDFPYPARGYIDNAQGSLTKEGNNVIVNVSGTFANGQTISFQGIAIPRN